jgi:hypothetical protein
LDWQNFCPNKYEDTRSILIFQVLKPTNGAYLQTSRANEITVMFFTVVGVDACPALRCFLPMQTAHRQRIVQHGVYARLDRRAAPQDQAVSDVPGTYRTRENPGELFGAFVLKTGVEFLPICAPAVLKYISVWVSET